MKTYCCRTIFTRILLIQVFALGWFGYANAQPYVIKDTFKLSGTFVVPPGVTSATIESWGGGGAGGGNNNANPGGGGGGGGAYTKVTGYSVTPGNSISVTVGTGGAGVSKSNGGDGNESYIGSFDCRASGGKGGLLNGTAGAGGATYQTYAGGGGAAGSGSSGGGGGSSAGTAANGNNGSGTTGGTAPTGGGKGGDASAGAGSWPGGGGGGSKKRSNGIGGNGADGLVVITYTLPSVTTLYWAGKGSNIGGTTGADFNTAANWSVSPNSYVTKGQTPNSSLDIVIRIEIKSSTALTCTISFSNPSTSINNLDFSLKNVESNSSSIQEAGLSLNTNQTFTILGNTILYAESNFINKGVQLTMDCRGDNAVMTYNGNLTTNAVEKATGSSAECIVYPFSNPVGTQNKGKFILRGNADLRGCGDDQSPQLNKPVSVVFDGTGTQVITNRNTENAAPISMYPVFLGYETKIGESNTPTVIFTGAETRGFSTIQSLTISPGATLILDPIQTIDCDKPYGSIPKISPGAFTMGANSFLILKGNNFPLKYSSYNFDPTSTVEYTSANGISQTIMGQDTIARNYGNLILTNSTGSGNSDKNVLGSLTIKGNLTVNPYITFNQSTYGITRTPAGGTYTLSNSDVHNLAGTYPSGFSTYSLATNSTTNYNGSGAQSVSPQNYGNLILSNAGTKTASGNFTVNGNLNIENSATLAGSSFSHTVYGMWTNNSAYSPGTSTINFVGGNAQSITGTATTAFNNLIINKSAGSNTVTNAATAKAFSANNVNVTTGTLVLQAIDNNYTINGNVVVAANGILTHSVSWDATYKALSIGGNLDVSGIFNPTVRSHVAMFGTGSKTIRTGSNPASTLSILTFSTGNYTANGPLKANQEVWAMFGTPGSFSTGGNTVTFPTVLNNMGSVNVNTGGTLNISGDAQIGISGSAGQLNIDGGGTMNIGGSLYNNTAAAIAFTGAAILNIKGNMVNNGAVSSGNETVTFNGTSDESISGANPFPVYNLNISGTKVVQSVDINIQNNLNVQSGIFNLQQYLCNRATAGGSMVVNAAATLLVGGSSGGTTGSNFPKNFSTYTLQNGSTVNYNGGTQTIFNTTYGNLKTENAGIKTAANNLSVLNSLTIGAASILNGGNYSHTIGGDWINQSSASAFDYGSGMVTFNGATAQSVGGSFGTSFYKFVMANSSASGITLNQPVNIFAALKSSGTGRKLNTNDQLTIKSSISRTAYVADMTGNTINGKATVERSVSSRKAWRMIAVPTSGTQTIKEAWQEGAVSESDNPTSGYGIQITGTPSDWAAKGFDSQSPSPSMKAYNPTNNSWEGVSNTNATAISGTRAYMVFVRGDRTVKDQWTAPSETNLRTKGYLNIGTQPAITVTPGEYSLVGNPYASPVDFTELIKGAYIDNSFYLWDPFLSGTYGLGGYQVFSAANGWEPLPGGTASHPSGVPSTTIQSSEAFFVHASTMADPIYGAPIQFIEGAKVEDNPVTFNRPDGITARKQFFRMSLTTPSNTIIDANAVAFADDYSNEVDVDDARKIVNSFENIGIKRGGALLAVEARNWNNTDTLFYQMSGLMKQAYRLRFVPVNIDRSAKARLIDKFKKSESAINLTDTTYYDFSVTADKNSSAADRFMVVFDRQGTLPVTFVKVNAFKQSDNILVEWKVADEKNNKEYVVERSTDGINFTAIGKVAVNAAYKGNYQLTDARPATGWNFYRIRNVDMDGHAQLSEIVKVNNGIKAGLIQVYPNPIVGAEVMISLNGQVPGKYQIRITNDLGQVVKQAVKNVISTNETIHLDWSATSPRGIYNLEISNDNGLKQSYRLKY